MVRTPSCDKSGLKKGTWTPEEDRKLIAYVTRYGCWNWRQLPKYAGLARCGKSCRLRWLNYLRPNIKRGNYTPQEEETVIKLHQQLGNRWSAIAAKLPGRTDNEIKNYWHTNLKKRLQHNKSKEEKEKESAELAVNNSSPMAMGDNSCQLSARSSSSITTAASCNELSLIGDDEFAFLDVNFWTDPFVADIFCDPTEAVSLPPLLSQSHSHNYFTTDSSCDAQLWTQHNVYDQYTGLFE